MTDKVRILGFAGSLRKGSYNRMVLAEAKKLAPPGVELEIFDLDGIPVFNQDYEKPDLMPGRVKEFKSSIRAAAAILIVTPEYNYSMPGVLKNAMDWASRPYGDNSFEGKAVGIMSASGGMTGASRAQYHLRQTFVFLNMHALNRPEVIIPQVNEKFDEDGNLTDEKTRQKISELLAELAIFASRFE